jgi:hypothetical protein
MDEPAQHITPTDVRRPNVRFPDGMFHHRGSKLKASMGEGHKILGFGP